MRWVLPALWMLALAANILLSWRMRDERIEEHVWKGFRSNPPFDLTGLEHLDRARYTPAGRRLYPWYVGSLVAMVVLLVATALAYMD